MSAPILLLNTRVEIQKTLGSQKTLTAITKASTGVASSTAHGFANGAIVVLAITGMVELDKRLARVANAAANAFDLEGIDTTNFSTFTAGTATEITAFDTFSQLQSFNMPEPAPNRIDYTTIHDTSKKEIFGLDDAATATFNMMADPKHVAVINLRTASLAKATRGFRVTLQDGTILLLNAYVAGGRGLDGQVGALATAQANLTLAAQEQYL